MLCFCQIGILIHKTNLHHSIIYGTWWIRHDVKPPPPRMVWVISSSAPLWFLYIYSICSIRWEKWWYLAPKESLLLIWLWIMQGFIWCQTMWQSSVLYDVVLVYGLWWTKAVYYIQNYYVVGLFSNPHGLFFSLLFALLPPSTTAIATTKLGDNPTDPKLCQSRNCFHRHQYLKVAKGGKLVRHNLQSFPKIEWHSRYST